MNDKNYYKILGVQHSASTNDIKKAYHQLAMKYHPDRNPNNKQAEERFKKINEAYEILRDPIQRTQYNQSLCSYNPPTESDKFSDIKEKIVNFIKQFIFITIFIFAINISTIIINGILNFLSNSIIFLKHAKSSTIFFYLTSIISINVLSSLMFYIFLSPIKQASLIRKLKIGLKIIGTIFFFIINFYLFGLFAFGANRRTYSSHHYASSKTPISSKASLPRIGR